MVKGLNYRDKSYNYIMIGIDEVGRGAWAGPLLVVAARQISELPGDLKDSKKLTKKSREKLIKEIIIACDLGHGWVDPAEIDKVGLTKAMKLAVSRALTELQAQNDEQIILDGNINYCEQKYTNVSCVVKADANYPIVSSASIYAKVTRDNLMYKFAKEYPKYGFENHVGYGTAQHIQALNTHGVTNIHRLSFKPIKDIL